MMMIGFQKVNGQSFNLPIAGGEPTVGSLRPPTENCKRQNSSEIKDFITC